MLHCYALNWSKSPSRNKDNYIEFLSLNLYYRVATSRCYVTYLPRSGVGVSKIQDQESQKFLQLFTTDMKHKILNWPSIRRGTLKNTKNHFFTPSSHLSLSLSFTHSHSDTHACTLTRTHKVPHTSAITQIHLQSLSPTHTFTHTHAHTHTQTHTHTHTIKHNRTIHVQSLSLPHTHKHKHTHWHTNTHKRTYLLTFLQRRRLKCVTHASVGVLLRRLSVNHSDIYSCNITL